MGLLERIRMIHRGGLACALAGTCTLLLTSCGDRVDVSTVAAASASAERQSLVSLARLEPSSKVVNVSSSVTDVIEAVLVSEGDRVERGQPLVRLKGRSLREAELEAAKIKREQAKLRPLEVEAQRARVRAVEAELEYAHEEVSSQKGLSEKGFSAGREFRDAKLRVRRSEEKLNEARADLKRMEASVELALRQAENNVVQAQAQYERTLVISPLTGQVLRVRAIEGERTTGRLLISVGATDEMYALGEVHANEIRLVSVGQRARFTSAALPEPIDGVVAEIGAMIYGNHITGEDPSGPKGLRVVPVRVKLDQNELASRLTNLEGQLRIFLDEAAHQ